MKVVLVAASISGKVRWRAERAVWALSMNLANGRWMAWTAALLVALCAGFVGTQLVPLHEQVVSLQTQSVNTELAHSTSPKVPASNRPLEPGDNWQVSLPDVHERTAILESMAEAAPKHNLYLQQAQYHWRDKPLSPFNAETAGAQDNTMRESILALQWILPVKGSYRDIREYVGELLELNPSLSLDSISLNREGPTGARLDADLSFTLYLRGSR